MKIFEQSFGKQEGFQKTAQFFNPSIGKMNEHVQKRRRENSLPQQNLEAIKSILSKTKILQKNVLCRKTTIHQMNDCKQENILSHQSTKQSTKQSTRLSTQDSQDLSSNIPKIVDLNIKHPINSFSVYNQKSSFHIRKQTLKEYSSQTTQLIENNSMINKISKSLEGKKYLIKVKNPFGESKEQQTQPTRKYSSKSFINQKAQIKLVNRIFSSRSESLQE
ncbi:unnamed protein product (macronuclear) [Paramecium tetraurelia]|uniref:HTH myb-type domain-containing protein n=1 Tax=Paramecium tetraurelia TaxID=5888 RepID=A0E0S5_PARTE|nr:uncharacterized protein GSPATT00022060001 [Paramecium tetraurelia]CAK88892.1 unnamed protein product [Paramecium tetraurelia]|eukprot:XP_001456289.1 hypothetical protein (macronuclear) [Paramecium tetraurelia strain d4-2]